MRKISEPTERLVPDRCREALYNEMMTALGRIAEEHMHLPAFRFFVDITRSWQEKMCGEMEKPLVVVAGTGIPDELLRAAGGVPSYILGGSREACMYSDDRVPRDADPVSRSILGYLYQMAVKDTSSLLILIPLYSDSMRKIAYQLNLAGWNVVTVDMPPLQDSSTALEKWKEQVLQATVAVADHVHVIRQKTRTEGISMTQSLYRRLTPVKWTMILLMFGLVFAGGEFCSFCPALVTSPVLAGMKVSIYLSGFMMVIVLVGSFFKRRFWCNICPLGYLIGLTHRISPFRVKKDTISCTECGACYEACPMGIKMIYTEREKTDVTDINCIMCGECVRSCPEDNALALAFAGKKFYTASRAGVMSGFEYDPHYEKEGVEQ